jgi:uncharacterized protein YbjT (DUF2867 family)
MKHRITIIGSTGLIGSHFLEGISKDDYQSVNAITRCKIANLDKKHFIKQSVHDFSDLGKMRLDLKTDVLVSALGTTILKAGSKDEFMKIDHDLPLDISRIAKEEGCRTMILISSMGANSKSKIFYNCVKGLLEESLEDLGFEEFHILRPSLLLGKRTETRPTEFISKLIMNPISFLIPWKYRPIHANNISNTIKYLIRENKSGKHIWEGRNLFEIEQFLS